MKALIYAVYALSLSLPISASPVTTSAPSPPPTLNGTGNNVLRNDNGAAIANTTFFLNSTLAAPGRLVVHCNPPSTANVSQPLTGGYRHTVSVNGIPGIRTAFAFGDNLPPVFKFRMGFLGLVEYNDTIPWNISNHRFPLVSPGWVGPVQNTTVASNNVTINKYSYNLQDVHSNLTVTLDTFIVPKLTTFWDTTNVTLRPNAIKYSLTIKNFPYQLINGKLGVIKILYTGHALNRTFDTDGRILIGSAGRYNWDATVNIGNNVTAPIIVDQTFRPDSNHEATNINDDDSDPDEVPSLVAFLVNATTPSFIHWDPDLTASTDPTVYDSTNSSSTDSSSSSSSSSAAVSAYVPKMSWMLATAFACGAFFLV